ncbi:MAG: hypothetical protein EXQ77_01925 [Thermoleophilia bacterium]|nr:hypothetical protein [Thermoleophilia bacterium]
MIERIPRLALVVLVVGLAAHNLALGLLWEAGLPSGPFGLLSAWKEGVLLAGLAAAALVALRRRNGLRFEHADRFALAYTLAVLLWWVLPQGWLGGEATAAGEAHAVRHHLLPVAGYLLGRLTPLDARAWRKLCGVILAVAAALAAWGFVDVYLLSLDAWRGTGVPGWYRDRLGFAYQCLSGLPENWVFNTGDETRPLRRLVSTFLSPLATAYALVIALLLVAASRPRRVTLAAGALAFAGLLWTHTRGAFLALAVGLAVLALLRHSLLHAGLAVASVAVAVAFLASYPSFAPTASYTASELTCLRANAVAEGGEGNALAGADSSTRNHLRSLREGAATVLRHPWGYGPGNGGATASRTGAEVKAGESTYVELAVDAGLPGALAFVGWLATLAVALRRRSAWLAASIVAVAAIGLQTDVIGVHWLAVTVFALAGSALRQPFDEPNEARRSASAGSTSTPSRST